MLSPWEQDGGMASMCDGGRVINEIFMTLEADVACSAVFVFHFVPLAMFIKQNIIAFIIG